MARVTDVRRSKPQTLIPDPAALETETVTARVDVRGHRAYHQSADPRSRVLSLAVDFSAGMIAFLCLLKKMGAVPVPTLWWPIAGCLLAAAFWIAGRLAFGVTLGERTWGLRPERPDADAGFAGRLRFEVRQAHRSGQFGNAGSAAFLTAASALAIPLAGWALFASHPIWLRAELLKVPPVDPAQLFPQSASASVEASAAMNAQADAPWVVNPFYYALGAWPAIFEGNPIYFTIPYQKGPPSRFIGHMIARWDSPETRLTLEGPKTPPLLASGAVTRTDLEVCLADSAITSTTCLRARKAALGRHLEEIQSAFQPTGWRLQWLVIDNPALPSAEQVQGMLLSARGDTHGQDRFVLVLPNGAEQTMILDYPISARGDHARELFMTSIRSLQVSPDLAQGIRWADHEIESVRLDDLQSLKKPGELAARLARIQSVLLGKLSVDPKTYDTYFHLAGTASLLAGQARKENREDWIAIASPMIQSLYFYAKDIAPEDPRTPQLEKLYLEIKNR